MHIKQDLVNQILFNEISLEEAQKISCEALNKYNHGELFCEYREFEVISLDDNHIKNVSFNADKGFGLRGVTEDFSYYVHSSAVNSQKLKQAANELKVMGKSFNLKLAENVNREQNLYLNNNPNNEFNQQQKIQLLQQINKYLRSKDSKIKEVSCTIISNWQVVSILKFDGRLASDIRPLVRLNISVVVDDGKNREAAGNGVGGRYNIKQLFTEECWQSTADEALRQALILLEAKPAPAGEMPVVLGNGWPGILLHEAVGHGLEGDFNRKKTSIYSDKLGERVAAKGVTIVDQGNIKDRRGSLNIDDEGNATKKNILIEDGILKSYMQDEINANLMKQNITGNGRRESYAHQPMPRMTNTFMLNGDCEQEEMIKKVKKGVFAKNFSGGQVDITSGNFVFSASEAYMIENGSITYPIKGMTLIGNGPDVMKKITMIGNDLALDPGIGTCGKNGQGVPVGVGQPSLLVDKMTIGGTNLDS
jgi:TldD protein